VARIRTELERLGLPCRVVGEDNLLAFHGEGQRTLYFHGHRDVVPETCSFTVERRFNPEEDLAVEKARLFSVLDDVRARGIALDVEVLQECDSSGVAEDHPVAAVLAECVETVTGTRPAFSMCPGALEIRWYARRGIPAFAYGPGLLDVSHGPQEDVEVESLFRSTLVYALAAVRLLS
jgi:succinyl-diaminopimelate desuccinylase